MEPSSGRKEKPKGKEPAARLEKAKQKSAQQELKQRQRAEVRGRRAVPARPRQPLLPLPRVPLPAQIYALNRVMTELEQQQFDSFCKQMQASGE
ncbi:SVBP protein, partial [Eudromia elegans]|nr:SVBP protein [Eudromia elegans]